MYPLDLDRLRLSGSKLTSQPKTRGRSPQRESGMFLRGPIPWDWLTSAAGTPGKALHVALVLWQLRGMTNKDTVRWQPAHAERFGLGRHAVYRGLKALAAAGLIAVEWKPGAAPLVTILPAPSVARGPPDAV